MQLKLACKSKFEEDKRLHQSTAHNYRALALIRIVARVRYQTIVYKLFKVLHVYSPTVPPQGV